MTPRILLVKTALDGHWRGITAVAIALRDAGFEVLLGGMARCDEIVQMAVQEDVDLVGLSIGGHIAVAERIIASLRESLPDVAIIAGGTLRPSDVQHLAVIGVPGFPPGSSLRDIVACARDLVRTPNVSKLSGDSN
jgi:methylmalonyl-CoA mutase, C-terminal domain